MARTDAGALLTSQHHRAQLTLRAATLRDYLTLWPLWTGQPGSFASLVAAAVPLVRARHRMSSALAEAYYSSVRLAEGVPGRFAVTAATLDERAVAGTLYLTGREMTRRAIAAGQQPDTAIQTALVRTSGTVSRFALAGGRDTLTAATREDTSAAGYRRILSDGSCEFCAMLAGRGVVYSRDTADFQAHDHCGCSAEPAFAA